MWNYQVESVKDGREGDGEGIPEKNEDPEGCDGAAQVPLLCQEVTAPVDLLILEVEFQWHLTLAQQELCLLNDLLRYILLIECYNILAMAAAN